MRTMPGLTATTWMVMPRLGRTIFSLRRRDRTSMGDLLCDDLLVQTAGAPCADRHMAALPARIPGAPALGRDRIGRRCSEGVGEPDRDIPSPRAGAFRPCF